MSGELYECACRPQPRQSLWRHSRPPPACPPASRTWPSASRIRAPSKPTSCLQC